jgi:hypothetical protein
MIQLITLDRAKEWLNIIHDHDDQKLYYMIGAASQAVLDYLGSEESEFVDTDGHVDAPEVEQAATAIMVGKLYDGMDPKELEYGRLPIEVTSMLYPRRKDMGVA